MYVTWHIYIYIYICVCISSVHLCLSQWFLNLEPSLGSYFLWYSLSLKERSTISAGCMWHGSNRHMYPQNLRSSSSPVKTCSKSVSTHCSMLSWEHIFSKQTGFSRWHHMTSNLGYNSLCSRIHKEILTNCLKMCQKMCRNAKISGDFWGDFPH